ncbi:DUF6228 family protein [Actinopolymorpha sp. B9G3]|uniref:DUF6228 family protein n=1 Tax=Actinopolymorpha sp. B9G3 TaxID=3158970 RepID=UPI0032D96C87
MSDVVQVIGHTRNGLALRDVRRLSDGVADQALFAVAKGGLTAESWVYAHNGDGFDGLTDFFRSMAKSWRGWDGARTWSSLEGDLTLTAKHDGHVRLLVQIRDSIDWSAEIELTIDAGEELTAAVAALSESLDS